MKGKVMVKESQRYVNSETGEVVSKLHPGAELVDYKKGMKLPTKSSVGASPDGDWSNWALAGGGGLLAHAIVSSLLEKSEKEKKYESPWMKLLRIIAPIGAGAAGAYAGYNLGKGLGKSAQTAHGPVRFYDAEKADQTLSDSASVQDLGHWASYAGSGLSGWLGAKNAKKWYDIVDARKRIPKVEAEISAIEGASGGAVSTVLNAAKLKAALKEHSALNGVARRSSGWVKGKTIGGLTGAYALGLLGYGLGRAAEENRSEAARIRGE